MSHDMRTPRPQARTRILHAAHLELEAACAEARAACHGGEHDGLTEAFDGFIKRVALVSKTLAGPAPAPIFSPSRSR